MRTGRATRRRLPGWASSLVLAVVVLLFGAASPGDAEPGSARAAARPASSGPGIPPVPADFGQDDQITFDPIVPSVAKAKVQFALRQLTFRGTLFECLTGQGFLYPDPCPFYDTRKLPVNDLPDEYWIVARTPTWVVSSPGPHPTYGTFPTVKVAALAFGSIPVTAQVHLTQTVHNNLYDPLTLNLVQLGAVSIPKGFEVYPGYGPAPSYGQDTQVAFNLPGSVTGPIEVRISDVTVDQVPVDVGPSCRTVRPAQLNLPIPGGYYNEDNDPGKHRDGPGGFLPLNSLTNPDGSLAAAGWLDGTVDIPSFAGCRDGAEDLSPLLTGLISGPNNPISAFANHALDLWCNSPLAHCPPAAAAEQRAALAVAGVGAPGRSIAQVKAAIRRWNQLRATAPPSRVPGPSAR